MSLTSDQKDMAFNLYAFAITTGNLYPQAMQIVSTNAGQGAWLGHTCKALRLYEKEIGMVQGMSHSFVIMQAASLIEDHYK